MNYREYYENQAASGYPVFQGYANQRGYGLGGIFKTLYKFIMPLFKTHALPVLKKGAEVLGTEAVKTTANIVNDAISGRNVKNSAQTHLTDAVNSLSSKAQSVIQGGSGKRKRKFKRKSIGSKRKKDIFD